MGAKVNQIKKNKILQKIISRDLAIFSMQLWTLGYLQIKDVFKEGYNIAVGSKTSRTFFIYRCDEEHQNTLKFFLKKFKEEPSAYQAIIEKTMLAIRSIKKILTNPITKKSLLKIKKFYIQAWPGVIANYYIPDLVANEMKILSPQHKKVLAYNQRLRTETEGFYDEVQHIFSDYARHFCPHFSEEDFLSLTFEDLVAKKCPTLQELQSRREAIVINGEVYPTTEGKKRIHQLGYKFEFERKSQNIGPISGQSAYPGKVQGIVRLIFNKREIDRITTGDILVTPMTTPDFLPAMKKAAAFVTDEGGILCHAAIISRELKKPCIIGTKIATQVLKDGDMIEVDADTGIVKIRPITTLQKKDKVNSEPVVLKDGDKIFQDDDNRINDIARWLQRGNWEFTIARKANPFNFYLAAHGNTILHLIVQKRNPPYNCNFRITNMPFWYGDKMYQNVNHIKELNEFLYTHLQSSKGVDFLLDLLNYFENKIDDLNKYIDNKIIPLSKKNTLDGYQDVFATFYSRFIECAGAFRILLAWSDVLEQRLKSKMNLSEEKFSKIAVSLKKPEIFIFQEEVNKISIPTRILRQVTANLTNDQVETLLKKGDNKIFLQIKNIKEKWAWITTLHYMGKPLTYQDIFNVYRISEKPSLAFKKSKDKEVHLLRHLIYLRTRIPEVLSMKGVFYLQILYKKIGKHYNLSYEETSVLFPEELNLIFENGVSSELRKELKIRKDGFDTLIIDGKIVTVFGSARDKLHRIVPFDSLRSSVKDSPVSGKTGYQGMVRGTARIVMGPNDFSKVQEGDILVTSSITPNFFPVMCKAAGIVTDEGGVTCHAAIISRELKKPCIIGTKIATQVFKDGDMIEVDANNGIVRKMRYK